MNLSHRLWSHLCATRRIFRSARVFGAGPPFALDGDPTELVTRAVQPALWLLIFGELFTHLRAIPTGGVPYLDFMTPGILA